MTLHADDATVYKTDRPLMFRCSTSVDDSTIGHDVAQLELWQHRMSCLTHNKSHHLGLFSTMSVRFGIVNKVSGRGSQHGTVGVEALTRLQRAAPCAA